MLRNLSEYIPGEHDGRTKKEIIESMLNSLGNNDEEGDQEEAGGEERNQQQNIPDGPAPNGWAGLVQAGPIVTQNYEDTTLLKLKKGNLKQVPVNEILKSLLTEQDDGKIAETAKDNATLTYLRQNLHVMAGNNTPQVPRTTSDEWVWYLYRTLLEKEIASLQQILLLGTAQTKQAEIFCCGYT